MNVDLKNMSAEEINDLVRGLQEEGYIPCDKATDYKKSALLISLKNRGAVNPYVCSSITRPIFMLADDLFYNKVQCGTQTRNNKFLPQDVAKRKAYVEFLDKIADIIMPFYNHMTGFCEKDNYDFDKMNKNYWA